MFAKSESEMPDSIFKKPCFSLEERSAPRISGNQIAAGNNRRAMDPHVVSLVITIINPRRGRTASAATAKVQTQSPSSAPSKPRPERVQRRHAIGVANQRQQRNQPNQHG